jgi:hypothetical protein
MCVQCSFGKHNARCYNRALFSAVLSGAVQNERATLGFVFHGVVQRDRALDYAAPLAETVEQ